MLYLIQNLVDGLTQVLVLFLGSLHQHAVFLLIMWRLKYRRCSLAPMANTRIQDLWTVPWRHLQLEAPSNSTQDLALTVFELLLMSWYVCLLSGCFYSLDFLLWANGASQGVVEVLKVLGWQIPFRTLVSKSLLILLISWLERGLSEDSTDMNCV